MCKQIHCFYIQDLALCLTHNRDSINTNWLTSCHTSIYFYTRKMNLSLALLQEAMWDIQTMSTVNSISIFSPFLTSTSLAFLYLWTLLYRRLSTSCYLFPCKSKWKAHLTFVKWLFKNSQKKEDYNFSSFLAKVSPNMRCHVTRISAWGESEEPSGTKSHTVLELEGTSAMTESTNYSKIALIIIKLPLESHCIVQHLDFGSVQMGWKIPAQLLPRSWPFNLS